MSLEGLTMPPAMTASGMFSKYGRTGVVVVVDSSMVEFHSHQGYVIVDWFDETHVESPPPATTYQSQWTGGTAPAPAPAPPPQSFVVTRRKFVMALDEESTVAKLHEELAAARHKEAQAHLDNHALVESANKVAEERDRARAELDRVRAVHDGCVDRFKRAVAANTDLGQRIDKVRTAIGAIEYDKIIGAGDAEKTS